MSSLPPWGTELILSVAAIGTAAVAIGLFMRATRDKKEPPSQEKPIPEVVSSISSLKTLPGTSLKSSDVERARKELRLLALERDEAGKPVGRISKKTFRLSSMRGKRPVCLFMSSYT